MTCPSASSWFIESDAVAHHALTFLHLSPYSFNIYIRVCFQRSLITYFKLLPGYKQVSGKVSILTVFQKDRNHRTCITVLNFS